MPRGDETINEGNRKPVTVAAVEQLISRLGGVSATRVVVNDWGGVEEVHVLATLERNPKQIVRDIESGLAAQFGLMLDRKKISVAQLVGLDPTLPADRLKLVKIEAGTDLEHGVQRVAVTLAGDEDDGPRYHGERQGPLGFAQSLRLAGEATLAAVNQSLDPDYLFALQTTQLTEAGPHRIALATSVLLGPRQEEQECLVGAAVSRGDDQDSVVRACLDAVNRRYTLTPRRKRGRGATSESSGAGLGGAVGSGIGLPLSPAKVAAVVGTGAAPAEAAAGADAPASTEATAGAAEAASAREA
ncbi:MAG: hypothetical protein ACYC5Y_12155 [Symbiobacteriia bacterium]